MNCCLVWEQHLWDVLNGWIWKIVSSWRMVKKKEKLFNFTYKTDISMLGFSPILTRFCRGQYISSIRTNFLTELDNSSNKCSWTFFLQTWLRISWSSSPTTCKDMNNDHSGLNVVLSVSWPRHGRIYGTMIDLTWWPWQKINISSVWSQSNTAMSLMLLDFKCFNSDPVLCEFHHCSGTHGVQKEPVKRHGESYPSALGWFCG